MEFFIVDAFSEALFGGNPAGVVRVAGEWPSDAMMVKTAAELRYSETAFIKRTGEDGFHTRYFTPAGEVELCGHATVAAFHALAEAGYIAFGGVYKNKTRAGLLDVSLIEGAVYMGMAPPQNPPGPAGQAEYAELYRVCGLAPEDMPPGLCPAASSAGLADIMLPVQNEEALGRIAPDFAALAEISKRWNVTGLHAFCPAGADGRPHCRNFAPLYGIDEEAATGTATGALTWYLYQRGFIGAGAETVFVQGEAMGRPSLLHSRLAAENGEVKIQVGGRAVTLARGEVFIQPF